MFAEINISHHKPVPSLQCDELRKTFYYVQINLVICQGKKNVLLYCCSGNLFSFIDKMSKKD